MNNLENGLIKSKSINGIKVTAKYLPPEFLVYKDLKTHDEFNTFLKDSLMEWYKFNHTFLLNIALDEENKNDMDVMRYGVKNYEEYKEKFISMNFDLTDFISLKIKDKKLSPVLINLENVYGLSKDRNVHLVFTTDEKTNYTDFEELDLVYNDEIFETGINHFVFQKKDIESIPLIKFWKK
ncbi:MAG: hypothetical protein H0V01_04455 [Bacteroidetes bacterium]|nr:hypothetical protein [Bacteroidota bacterium]HET6243903.1 hypothetical protein [Bacteroidia bacterium]